MRFAINPGGSGDGAARTNGYAGVPAMVGLGRHYELTVTCRGEADPVTGYFLGIQEIDRAVRRAGVPLIERACRERPEAEPGAVLPEVALAVNAELGGIVERVRWHLSPFYSVEVSVPMTQPAKVMLRQRFEFAAAHRLHAPSLSESENRAVFGKCNNPLGHGHNYVVEPAVEVVADGVAGAPPFSLAMLERAVDSAILQVMDHKHLNLEVPEFVSPGGLNPSVENIAKVCFERLAPVVAAGSGGAARLVTMTVFETEKTSCTYPA